MQDLLLTEEPVSIPTNLTEKKIHWRNVSALETAAIAGLEEKH